MEQPETQYAQSGDLSIAYQVVGDGPIDLVFVPGFISHQEIAWDVRAAPSCSRRAAFARLIFFDKRGTGLSDRTLGFGTAEDRMDDIRAVMDAAGSERAALIGVSEGGPLAILFAATYPGTDDALVLWTTYARVLAPDYPIGAAPELADQLSSRASERWGTGDALPFFVRASRRRRDASGSWRATSGMRHARRWPRRPARNVEHRRPDRAPGDLGTDARAHRAATIRCALRWAGTSPSTSTARASSSSPATST